MLYVPQAYAALNGGHLDDQLYGLTKSMTQLGLQPTKRMHSLGMEAALRTNNLEVGHHCYLTPHLACVHHQANTGRCVVLLCQVGSDSTAQVCQCALKLLKPDLVIPYKL